MSEGLNRVMLMGNLGADPELRFGQGPDTAVLKLRLATTESYFDKRSNERKERTDWHNVVVFGKRGEALQKILQKGSTIFVEGRLQTGSYEKDGQKHYRTDVVATNVILAGRNPNSGNSERRDPPNRDRPSFEQQRDRANDAFGNKHVQTGGGDDFGGYADDGGGDSDIPFISQADTIRDRLR
jgi:single-strand DNA-binding protein